MPCIKFDMIVMVIQTPPPHIMRYQYLMCKMRLTGLHDSQARVLAYYSLAFTSMSLSERPFL